MTIKLPPLGLGGEQLGGHGWGNVSDMAYIYDWFLRFAFWEIKCLKN